MCVPLSSLLDDRGLDKKLHYGSIVIKEPALSQADYFFLSIEIIYHYFHEVSIIYSLKNLYV